MYLPSPTPCPPCTISYTTAYLRSAPNMTHRQTPQNKHTNAQFGYLRPFTSSVMVAEKSIVCRPRGQRRTISLSCSRKCSSSILHKHKQTTTWCFQLIVRLRKGANRFFSQLRDVIHRNLAYLEGHEPPLNTAGGTQRGLIRAQRWRFFRSTPPSRCQHQNPYFSTGVEFPI